MDLISVPIAKRTSDQPGRKKKKKKKITIKRKPIPKNRGTITLKRKNEVTIDDRKRRESEITPVGEIRVEEGKEDASKLLIKTRKENTSLISEIAHLKFLLEKTRSYSIEGIADKIEFLRMTDPEIEDEDESLIKAPEDLDAFGKITYLVNNFEKVAHRWALENILPQLQDQIEEYTEELHRVHEEEISNLKDQLKGKDEEYEDQTLFIQDRERMHLMLRNQFRVKSAPGSKEYLKKQAKTEALLNMTRKSLGEERRKKENAIRKAEKAKQSQTTFEKKNIEATVEIQTLTKQVRDLKVKLSNVSAKVDLKPKITKLEFDLSCKSSAIEGLKKTILELTTKISKLEREALPLAKERDRYRSELSSSRGKFKTKELEMNKKLSKLEETLKNHEEISLNARKVARQEMTKSTESTGKLETIRREYERVKVQLMELNDAKVKYERMAEESSRQEVQSMSYKKYADKATNERDSLLAINKTLVQKNDLLKDYNKNWAISSKSWKKERDSLLSVVQNSKLEIESLISQNVDLGKAVITLEDLVYKQSVQNGDRDSFSNVTKKIALEQVSSTLFILNSLKGMGFNHNEKLKIMTLKTEEFAKALASCENGEPNQETLKVLNDYMTQNPPYSTKDNVDLFNGAKSCLDICKVTFFDMSKRWKDSLEKIDSNSKKHLASTSEQRRMFAKELTALKLKAHAAEGGEIEESFNDHIRIMDSIKDTKDGIRALGEIQHMQAFVEFIRDNIKWGSH